MDASPGGLSPTDLQSAYSLPSSAAGAGETVAIVDAYDQPNAAADLAAYRSQYGLPSINQWTGTATPTPWFRKVDQTGGTSYPAVDNGWGLEISLDIEMVSAICPGCNILLVEANSASMGDLGSAVNEAAALGATAISNSYIGGESVFERFFYDGYYNHPGIAITAASGDSGYGAGYPAASHYVTAVGGTTLTRDSGTTRGWTETAWDGAGSGCSAYESKPAWQTDAGCGNRTIADVSAVSSISSPVAVYDSSGYGGWIQVYGTSVATPIVASVYALAGTPAAGTNPASYPYANPGALNDVTSGSNGTCSPSYLCNAVSGYDGPTGLGTPNGTAAFAAPGASGVAPTITSATGATFTEGAAGSFTVTATGSPTPALSESGSLPGGVTFTDNGDGTASLSGTPAAGSAGTYQLTITATNGVSPDASQSFTLTVDAPVSNDFSVSASPASLSVAQGDSGETTISTAVTSGTAEAVTLSVVGLPSGATATFGTNPVTAGGSSTLTLTVGSGVAAGTYALTVTGTAASGSHTTSVSLTVTAPASSDFSLSVSPVSQSVQRGGSARYTVTIAAIGGFTGSVTLSVTGAPPGSKVAFSPNPATTSSTLTIRTQRKHTGTYTLTITGVSGSLTHTVTTGLTVTAR